MYMLYDELLGASSNEIPASNPNDCISVTPDVEPAWI